MNARIIAVCVMLSLLMGFNAAAESDSASTPPEVLIGKRLFLETRFAQAYFAQSNGDVNRTDIPGDPVLATTMTTGSPLPGPFSGKTMNCRACHMEDEQSTSAGGGMRTYTDFARRSPIPDRGDGKTTTTRNSPTLVGASLSRQAFFLHFDGEFATGPDLVQGGFTGRNFGWLPSENSTAIKHIARVIREDNGQGSLAQQFGGAYAKVFGGDPSVPIQFQLPPTFRLDVTHASDKKVLAAVGALVNQYLKSLEFSKSSDGSHNGSPYDFFLIRNNLPRQPDPGESALDYSRRLRAAVNGLTAPVFVTPADGTFTSHDIPFQFGADELAGLQMFLAEGVPGGPGQNAPPPPPGGTGGPRAAPGIGNCIGCHAAPEFTDFLFHNTGVSQLEYDSVHGNGAFEQLKIPTLTERKKAFADTLPATPRHPNNKGTFRSIPSPDRPNDVDLGLWNVFANTDYPKPQKELRILFGKMKDSDALNKTIANFKTPGLRDLGHSQPYLHNGSLDTIDEVMSFYLRVSQMARQNQIRNADPRLAGIQIDPDQAAKIASFLNALNEDFQD